MTPPTKTDLIHVIIGKPLEEALLIAMKNRYECTIVYDAKPIKPAGRRHLTLRVDGENRVVRAV